MQISGRCTGTVNDQTFSLVNIDRAFLTGTAANQTFDISEWTARGNNRGSDFLWWQDRWWQW